MTGKDLLQALNDIDDILIREADDGRRSSADRAADRDHIVHIASERKKRDAARRKKLNRITAAVITIAAVAVIALMTGGLLRNARIRNAADRAVSDRNAVKEVMDNTEANTAVTEAPVKAESAQVVVPTPLSETPAATSVPQERVQTGGAPAEAVPADSEKLQQKPELSQETGAVPTPGTVQGQEVRSAAEPKYLNDNAQGEEEAALEAQAALFNENAAAEEEYVFEELEQEAGAYEPVPLERPEAVADPSVGGGKGAVVMSGSDQDRTVITADDGQEYVFDETPVLDPDQALFDETAAADELREEFGGDGTGDFDMAIPGDDGMEPFEEEGLGGDVTEAFEATGAAAAVAELSNPIVEYDSFEALKAAVGFGIDVPQNVSGLGLGAITAIDGYLIEIRYGDGAGESALSIRKAYSGNDIIGDYNQYSDIITEEIAGSTVTMKGNGGAVSLAYWDAGDFGYVIEAQSYPIEPAMIAELVQQIR